MRHLEDGPALLVQLAGILDHEDGVLARQTDQHDQADLHEDVHVALRVQDARNGAEQAERHDQDHRQRQRPALIQGGQRHEHADDGQQEHVDRGVARPDLHEHQLGPLALHRQRQALGRLRTDLVDRVARAHSLDVAIERGGLEEVVAGHRDRAADLAGMNQGSQRDHLLPPVPHLEQVDVFDPIAVPALRLDGYLPVPSESIEAVDVERAQIHR